MVVGTPPQPPLAVRELWDRGRAAWPGIELDLEAFAAHLERCLGAAIDPALAARLHAEDVYLACACARGIPAAAMAFEELYAGTIERAVGRIAASREAANELRQDLLVRLLVPESLGEAARIAQYSGRGSLAAWVSVAAGRTALNRRRDAAHERATGTVEERLAARAVADANDPELELIRDRYHTAFTAALARALTALDRDHRSLLRLHYVDGLTMDALAALFRVSRAGAHRRLATAREVLFERTCALLRVELRLDTAELTSLLRLVKTDLDLSLAGLLRDHPEAPPT